MVCTLVFSLVNCARTGYLGAGGLLVRIAQFWACCFDGTFNRRDFGIESVVVKAGFVFPILYHVFFWRE